MNDFEHRILYKKIMEEHKHRMDSLQEEEYILKDTLLYDRMGKIIPFEEWVILVECEEYYLLNKEHVEDYLVTTTWTGVNQSNEEKPMIFMSDVKHRKTGITLRSYIANETTAHKYHNMLCFIADQKSMPEFMGV